MRSISTIKLTRSLLGLFLLLFLAGCYYDKEELLYPGGNQAVNCSTTAAKFSANVLPLVTSKCAIPNCHNSSAAGGLVFQNYSQISAAKDRINQRVVVEKSMPPTGALPAADIAILQCWIESGAPNN